MIHSPRSMLCLTSAGQVSTNEALLSERQTSCEGPLLLWASSRSLCRAARREKTGQQHKPGIWDAPTTARESQMRTVNERGSKSFSFTVGWPASGACEPALESPLSTNREGGVAADSAAPLVGMLETSVDTSFGSSFSTSVHLATGELCRVPMRCPLQEVASLLTRT